MSDEFLTKFEERRAARAQADRTILLAGEKLTFRASVAPEVGFRLQAMRREVSDQIAEVRRQLAAANGDGVDPGIVGLIRSDEDMVQVGDETVIGCLEPSSAETWGRLRSADAAQPLTFEEIFEVADYLLARVAGVPTGAPADSSAGRTTTSPASKAPSSSQATPATA